MQHETGAHKASNEAGVGAPFCRNRMTRGVNCRPPSSTVLASRKQLCSGDAGRNQSSRCVWPVTHVFQSKIYLAELSRVLCVRVNLLFSVALYQFRAVRTFNLDLLQT